MKKHLLTLTFGICSTMLAFTACKKENDADPSNSHAILCLPDSSFGTKGDKTVISYDNQSRITKSEQFDSTGNLIGYTTITYSDDKIMTDNYQNGKLKHHADFLLNEQGYINSKYIIYYNEYTRYDTTLYTYDNEGYRIMDVYKDTYRNDTAIYKYQDGNLKTQEFIGWDGKSITTYTYSTIENKGFNFLNDVGSANLFGKGNKNLVESDIEVNPDGSTLSTTYSYQFNSDGLVTKYGFVAISSQKPSEPYFTTEIGISYKCK